MKKLKYIIFLIIFSIPVLTQAQSLYYTFIPVTEQRCCFDIDLNNWGAATAWNCFQIKIINNNTQQTYIVSTDPSAGYTTDPSSIKPQTTSVKWIGDVPFPITVSVIVGRICFTQHSFPGNLLYNILHTSNLEQI